jgi:YVTN family beta-propeller protein
LTPDGGTLVSVNVGSGSVGLFNAGSLVLQERVSVGNGPTSALIDPSGRRAFVFNTQSSSVSVVDIAGRSLTATVSTDSAPLRGQLGVRGDRLYVIHERSPYMTVLDPRNLTLITRARLRAAAGAIEIDHVRGLLCLGSSRDAAVEFYDPNALMPLYAMRVKAGVSFLRIDVEDNSLYLVNPDTRSLIVGRLTDRRVSAEIDVGDRPYWAAVMGER